eukprot:1133221-Pelagomonas_calceolata.AAC.4
MKRFGKRHKLEHGLPWQFLSSAEIALMTSLSLESASPETADEQSKEGRRHKELTVNVSNCPHENSPREEVASFPERHTYTENFRKSSLTWRCSLPDHSCMRHASPVIHLSISSLHLNAHVSCHITGAYTADPRSRGLVGTAAHATQLLPTLASLFFKSTATRCFLGVILNSAQTAPRSD